MRSETYDSCPAIRERPRNCPDLAGMRYGTLTVVGYHVPGTAHAHRANAGKGNPLWVVRCDCGAFETRPAKIIRLKVEERSASGCCSRCHARRVRERALERGADATMIAKAEPTNIERGA